MSKTKYRSKQKYKESLYSNLLMACVMSECNEEDALIHPKLVTKPDVHVNGESLIRHQQTFVMRWNPEISSHKVADFEYAMENFYDDGFYYDWSIFDHDKVHIGDRFFMLKVGNSNTGIVMSGIIVSLPYKYEDWSGMGRDVHHVRLMPDCMIHPNKSKMVTTQELDEILPGVNWNEGHSGVLLSDEQSGKFIEIWQSFIGCLLKNRI